MGRPRGPPRDGRLGPHGVHAGRRSGRVPRVVGPTCGQSTPRFPLGPSGHGPTSARSSPHAGCGRPSAQRADPSADRNKWAFGVLCNRSSLATAVAASRNPTTADSPPVGAFAFAIRCLRVMSVSRWAGRPVPPGGAAPSLPACVPACRYCFSQSRNVQPDRTGPTPASCVDRRTHPLTHSLVGRHSDRRAWHGCAVDKQCVAFDGPCGMKYSASPRQVEPQATSAPGLGSPLPHLRRDWAHLCHICAGTGLTHGASPPGLDPRTCTGTGRGPGLPLLHLRL
jgi:hypothetical protein